MQVSFGSGSLFAIPTGANPTPVQFGVLQDVAFDYNFALKELRGQWQFPVALARGSGKITWKAKFAKLNGAALNSLFFNGSNATGLELAAIAESGTVAAAAITVVNAANFQTDMGVVNGNTGVQYVRVASGPVAGVSYTVTGGGVYGFNATDNGVPMLISYSYTAAAGGNKTTVTNQLMGNQTTFSMIFNEKFNGNTWQLRFPMAVMNKLGMATKLEDFTLAEADGECYADAGGNVVYQSMVE